MELVQELFIEILIAGVLFAFGISPMIIRFSPSVRDEKGLLPGIGSTRQWQPWVILAIAFVYAAGVGGNRLVEVLYKDVIPIEANIKDNQGKPFHAGEAEFHARTSGEIYRDWVERHKTYRKILRAASFSSVLFILSMLYYHISIWVSVQRKWIQPDAIPFGRYGARHYAAALLSVAFFTSAFHQEDHHFKCNLFQHQMRFMTPAAAQVGQASTNAAPMAPACR